MFQYHAYNLQIQSDFLLPGYIKAESSTAPNNLSIVKIVHNDLDREELKKYHDDGMKLGGEHPGILLCRIENGEKMEVNPVPEADHQFVNTVISGELMAALLRQRGHLVLHGSSVEKNGKAIAFLGNSGWGKSTTAAYFLNHGYTLMGEDLLVLDFTGSAVQVLPGPQTLKLRSDAGEYLLEKFDNLPVAYEGTSKRIFQSESGQHSITNSTATLQKLYLLEKEDRGQNKIIPISKQQALIELVKHTRVARWITGKAFRKTHLMQCTSLLNQIDVAVLQRKRSLQSLSELRDLIEKDREG